MLHFLLLEGWKDSKVETLLCTLVCFHSAEGIKWGQTQKDLISINKIILIIPNKGIASETWGSFSVTILWKTVKERRIVTPENWSNFLTHHKFNPNRSRKDEKG